MNREEEVYSDDRSAKREKPKLQKKSEFWLLAWQTFDPLL